jgi:hypothetical protein
LLQGQAVKCAKVTHGYRQLATEKGDGWRLPATSDFLEQWGITDSALRETVGNRLTDFALACQTQPVVYDPASLDTVRKIYVRHTAPQMASLHRFWERAVSSGWQTEEIATGHDMMLQDPQSTVDLLMQIAMTWAQKKCLSRKVTVWLLLTVLTRNRSYH